MEEEHECLLPEKRVQRPDKYILPLDNHSATQETLPLASDTSTFCNAIIAFLGSGVLGFPYAFKETGIVLGLVLLTFVAFITGFCMLLLIECKYKIQSKYNVTLTTYGEIGSFLMGTTGEWLVNVSLVISQAGFTVGYLIFIAANVHAYREDLPKPIIVAYCAPLLILFCLLKHIKQLSYVALVADLMNFTGLSMVYVMDYTYMDLSVSSTSFPVWGGVWASLPFFLGVSTYCFAGIGMALPLENAMEHKHHFKTILVRTILLLECVYASFGICGYLAFQNETQDVITLNIKGPGTIPTSIKLFLCVGLLCSCPLMLFPVFETLQGSFFPHQQLSTSKNFFFRTIIIMIVATIAGGAPHFGTFIALIGSTCCSFLGFVLPVLFHYQLFKDSCSKRYQLVAVLITFVGMAMVSSGVYTTI